MPWTFRLMVFLCGLANNHAQIYLSCEAGQFTDEESCRCWNPPSPTISCTSAGMASIPNVSQAHDLDLSDNRLTDIPAFAFSRVRGLRNVILRGNSISSVNLKAFGNMTPGVERLDLSRNNFEAIPDLFGREQGALGELTYLNLADNSITLVPNYAFAALTNLEILSLKGNTIRHISPLAWRGLPILEHISLGVAGMDPRTIPIDGLRRLQGLSLCGAHRTKLDVFMEWLEPFTQLTHLELCRMGLTDQHLGRGQFSSTLKNQLWSLSLQGNDLTHVPRDVRDFARLKSLDLSQNSISFLSDGVIPPMVQNLNMSGNVLYRILYRLLLTLPLARKVDLRQNKFKDLSSSLWKYRGLMSPTLTLYLGGNPWTCGCGHVLVKRLVDQKLLVGTGFLTRKDIYNDIRCGPAGSHNGELIMNVPLRVFDCSKNN